MAATETELGVAEGQVLQLTDSGIGDDEVHALAALLRGENNITELILHHNEITSDEVRGGCCCNIILRMCITITPHPYNYSRRNKQVFYIMRDSGCDTAVDN